MVVLFPIAAIGLILLIFSLYLPHMNRREETHLLSRDKALSARDRAVCAAITLVYAGVAFAGLGVNTAPQTFCRFEERGQYALIELGEPSEISALMYYTGLYSGAYRLQFSADGEEWADQESMEQAHGDLFKWQYAELAAENGPVKFVRIIADSELWLGEVVLYDGGEAIPAAALRYDDGTAPLFDEQDTAPEAPGYLNGAYFDEIYHARTAFENVQNVYPYEISHPPLGKLILSIGIRLFGMTPFGWRCMGTLFGVLMLPGMYVFLKKLFGGTAVPACCTAVFAFDFMHYTQTRIATIDTYGVFFTILMYLFFWLYLTAERDVNVPRRGWLPYLALSGLCFGLGAACKWTCLYAGAGLGVLWLCDRMQRGLRVYRAGNELAETDKAGQTDGGETPEMSETPEQELPVPAEIRADHIRETADNILWCLVFFVLVPCLVYYLSYYPYGKASGLSGPGMYFTREYLHIVLDNQRYMFSYHIGVDATHPYSSRWYQWMFDVRPILYYLDYFDDGSRSSFGAFVDPMLCWGGLLAMLAMVWRCLAARDRRAGFILIAYLAQLLPWVFIKRITFEYHYFPSTVFLTLALGYVFNELREREIHWRAALCAFTAACVGLFALFYPVLSGLRIPDWYAAHFLRWIPSYWPF